jgi:GNAT superfamily N-acetyltransferase
VTTAIETRDGVPLTVRPIQADDKSALLEAFEHLSDESVYKRFLSPLKRLTKEDLAYLTELDHERHEALVATTPLEEIVGVARSVRLAGDPTRAEVAVTVADEWQGRGVGTALLRLLGRRGRENGIERFTGVCLAQNAEMLQLFRELGPTHEHPAGDGVVEVEVTLPTTAAHAIGPILRAAAAAFHRRR